MDSASDSDDEVDVDEHLGTSSDSLDLAECLRLQYAELEMLESMFPEELTVSDEEAVVLFKSFVETLEDNVDDILKAELPPNLSFDIKLDMDAFNGDDGGGGVKKVELSLTLPLFYPFMRPTAMLRTGMNRSKQSRLRRSMEDFLASHPEGELFVANLIEFVREAVIRIQTKEDEGREGEKKDEIESSNNNDGLDGLDAKYVRMWIYSHHIYRYGNERIVDILIALIQFG